MPDVRELPALRPVPYDVVTREEFQAELQQVFDEQVDQDALAGQGRFLQRLGLLPPDSDLGELLLDLTGGGLAAYYRSDLEQIKIIERSEPFGPLDRVFVAHEYTHALQDQHFDMDANRITDLSEGDAALAQLAAIEGDASAAMVVWAQQNLSMQEMLEFLTSALAFNDPTALADMPLILSRQAEFPYSDGLTFETLLQQRDGWAAVNETIRNPPPSTEQILHPEKYDSGEAPIEVDLVDLSAALGEGWSRTYLDTLGELNIQILAAGDERPDPVLPGFPGGEWPHGDAAAGWGGDRVAMWEGPGGEWVIVWLTAWDTTTDANEFAVRVDELKTRFGGPAQVERIVVVDALPPQDLVRLVIASDATLLNEANAALH
jgi:hypothetical protein